MKDYEYGLPYIMRKMLDFESGTSFDLEVITASKLTTLLEITGMTKEGTFKLGLTTDGLTAAQTTIFNLPDLPIWLTVKTDGITASVNDVFVMVYVRANKTRLQLLCQGFIGQFSGINFPNQVPLSPLQISGNMGRVGIANPAAGAEFSITIPAGEYWKINQIYATLTTDATVASRRPVLALRDIAGTQTRIPSAADITAGQAAKLHWFKGAGVINDATGLYQSMPFPMELLLSPGYIILSATANIQAADQWSAISIYRSIFYSA